MSGRKDVCRIVKHLPPSVAAEGARIPFENVPCKPLFAPPLDFNVSQIHKDITYPVGFLQAQCAIFGT